MDHADRTTGRCHNRHLTVMAAALAILALCLDLRSFAASGFDIALLDLWPYATHVFQLLLIGTVIALLLPAFTRHITRTPAP